VFNFQIDLGRWVRPHLAPMQPAGKESEGMVDKALVEAQAQAKMSGE